MHDRISFGKGFVYSRNLLYVDASLDSWDEKDIYHTIMLRCLDRQWSNWTIANRIVAHCAFDAPRGRTVLALGLDGRVQIGDSSGFHWESVGSGPDGSSALRHVTSMRIVGNQIFVVGMQRQVYRKAMDGTSWERADQGILVPRTSPEVTGFKSIDGFHEQDVYAVGFYGEIWHYNGSEWRRCDSPTNLKLECVRCVQPHTVYICGASGLLFEGDEDHWALVENQHTKHTFWSMEDFLGSLYLSTNQGTVFKLVEQEIVPVNMQLDSEISTNWLHANDGILLSTGSSDLVVFDGNKWEKLASPSPDIG